MTGGEAVFCNFCGKSFDVKLCPRLHQNSRSAEVCSKCGSRELSTPQPKIPMTWRLLAILLRLGLGLVLLYASLSVVIALLRSPQMQKSLVALGMLLSLLWMFWTKLPDWLQEAIRALWMRKENKDD
jgi:DNA-directed RNA polymerase subunit RPC12/RpoP